MIEKLINELCSLIEEKNRYKEKFEQNEKWLIRLGLIQKWIDLAKDNQLHQIIVLFASDNTNNFIYSYGGGKYFNNSIEFYHKQNGDYIEITSLEQLKQLLKDDTTIKPIN